MFGRRAFLYAAPDFLSGCPFTHIYFQLAQLLLAQVDFSSPGMYNSIAVGSLGEKTKAARDAMAVDFDLHSLPLYADDAKSQAMLPPARPEMAYKWANAMMSKGVSREDIQFLANTLNPLPEAGSRRSRS